ncbi:alpha/beta hydrolase [Microbacterium gorillae]|uniref:alpha/beta hydrolase n=1 Tax=Microbacterium gorillae TaxID=1231063 RepID=UPI000590254F|nr:alpha/beta fold hydrolase [Microbacterium gorillae]
MIPALDPDVVQWSVAPDERGDRPVVLLLHGYGSDELDLTGLIPHLPDAFVYAAVRAPLSPPWPAPGYSWYPIEGLDDRSAEPITAAARRVLEWADAVGLGEFGMLGFSQGGAVSLQTLRVAPERVSFVVNLAGYATPGEVPGDATLRTAKPPVFWGRGALDQVIPEPLVAHTVEWLPGYSDLSGRVYAGLAHAVNGDELADVATFLAKRLS